jgi:carboxypeptidase PM20D1
VGRGAIDDKGPLIAILEAIEGLLADGFSPARTVHVAFGHTEESTDRPGAEMVAAMLRDRGVRAQLVLDEGGFVSDGVVPMTRGAVALVGVAEKGYLDLELTARGVTGHSSQPPRHTAIGGLARAVTRLEDRPMPARVGLVRDLLDAAGTTAPRSRRLALRALSRLGPVSRRVLGARPATNAAIRTTMAATIVEGGVKANVLPSTARVILNARIAPGDTVDGVVAHVRGTVGPEIEVRSIRAHDPTPIADTSSAGYRLVADTIREIAPDAVVAPWILVGTTDSRFFTSMCDTILRFVPFRVGPGEIAGIHGADERIRLSDAEPAVAFYRRLIERASGG